MCADSVKLGGASAGSLLAACIKSGLPLGDIVEHNLRLMDDLRRGGTRGRLGVRLALACRLAVSVFALSPTQLASVR
jgi:hypothetical protein